MPNQTALTNILLKRLYASLTAEEQQSLGQWLQQSAHNQALLQEIDSEEGLQKLIQNNLNKEVAAARVLERLQQQLFVESPGIQPAHRVHFLRTAFFRYAAAVLLILGAGGYFYFRKFLEKPIIANVDPIPVKRDVLPGGNKALLTLADGSTIVLDSAAIGALANQGASRITKNDSGSLTYTTGNLNSTAGNTAVLYNIVSTPKGGQYQVVLPDGTKVWLNATSSIRFPASFANERTVQVTGELYFEVTHNKNKPFTVQTGTSDIQVLGTKFNVNMYADEPAITTSLLEGKVAVTRGSDNLTLLPGEQAICATQGALSVNHNPDMEQVMAWKNGLFNFNAMDLRQAMRQIAKWYNLEVSYAPGVPNPKFWGKMQRNLTLAQLLDLLNTTSVRFTIQANNRLLVEPR